MTDEQSASRHALPLEGKTVLVTGANTGIGRETARQLARKGARVWLACRSLDKAQPVVAQIRAETGRADAAEALGCNLASLRSVRQAVRELLDRESRLDVVVANAGVGGQRGVTEDGFELHFGVNHLGHFLLVTSLLPRLRAHAPARVVVVASHSHYQARGIDWEAVRGPTRTALGIREYAVSKLANVLFVAELARGRAGAGVHAYAVHPGVVASDIWRRVPWPIRPLMRAFMLSNERGAFSSVHCASAAEVASDNGLYYDQNGRPRRPSRAARDEALARELWERSERWVAEAG
ncbi:MAG: SDR family oxidoreductase [Myxococcota bacterium]|nr:SDR family oxidoreductase [Myxococcota bacterium]MDW8362721.1 SDR family oxidoreductase [Myxococcales bacterium]